MALPPLGNQTYAGIITMVLPNIDLIILGNNIAQTYNSDAKSAPKSGISIGPMDPLGVVCILLLPYTFTFMSSPTAARNRLVRVLTRLKTRILQDTKKPPETERPWPIGQWNQSWYWYAVAQAAKDNLIVWWKDPVSESWRTFDEDNEQRLQLTGRNGLDRCHLRVLKYKLHQSLVSKSKLSSLLCYVAQSCHAHANL